MTPTFWSGKRVFLTGHTGFKGRWLALWLQQLGAQVTGYALDAPTQPSLFDVARLGNDMESVHGDMRDLPALLRAMQAAQPEIVFHMAALPLVRLSYETPVETYATNVMGTVHLLEAVRQTPGVKSVVNITTDKCYENKEWAWGYRENEPMGGFDPYSNSKGCSKLVSAAYRSSFFNPNQYARHGVALATSRARDELGLQAWTGTSAALEYGLCRREYNEMGILASAACLLMQEGKRQAFCGKVLQLGRQDIWFNQEGLRTIANHVGFQLHVPAEGVPPDPAQRLSDVYFFKSLGFSEVESMEYGTEEHANYVHDLNEIVSPAYFERFDAIYDGGTVEHVFNVPHCLSRICHMLKIGGRVLHDAGASGLIDHGFYALQPTLFCDYYLPGMYDFENTWAMSTTDYFGVFCSATKLHAFTKAVTPQQSIWVQLAARKKES